MLGPREVLQPLVARLVHRGRRRLARGQAARHQHARIGLEGVERLHRPLTQRAAAVDADERNAAVGARLEGGREAREKGWAEQVLLQVAYVGQPASA